MNSILPGLEAFGSVSVVEATVELERLLADPAFKSPERNRRFLRFVAEECFAGRGDILKAYTIAVDAFGRPPSFDPSTDSIVRIEAVRLRNALAQYYDAHPDTLIRIELPKGRYVPMFFRLCPLIERAKSARSIKLPLIGHLVGRLRGSHEEMEAISGSRRSNVTVTISVICGVVALAVGALVSYSMITGTSAISDRPAIAIEMMIAPGDETGEIVKDAIMVSLSQFQTLRTVWRDDPSAQPAASSSITSSTGLARDRVNRYIVKLKHSADKDGQSVIWQVINEKTGETLRSGSEQVSNAPATELPPEQSLARSVAATLAGRHGVINELELVSESVSPTLGNGCLVRATSTIESPTPQEASDAIQCLRATLAIRPNNSDANAVLSLILARDAPEESLVFANKAVMLAPSSDRARMAQSLALYWSGKTEAAITAGYRAIAMNPANSALPSKLSSMVYLTGHWDEGVGLAIKSGLIDTYPHRDASMTLALDAYRTGAYDEALFRAREMTDGDPLDEILLAATLGQQGAIDAARTTIASMQRRNAGVLDTLRRDLAARHFPVVLIDALADGLTKGAATVH